MRVVVCGAGVVGAAVAYYLSRRGVGAILVEREGVACAASGKSGGFLAEDWCRGQAQDPLARASFRLHQELAETLGADTGYRRLETLAVGASERRDVSGHARLARPEWLTGACAVAARIGTTHTTAQVHSARFTRALVDTAVAAGAGLHLGTVDGLLTSPDGSAARGVTVNGASLEADAVVVAMGPWSDRFRDPLGLPAIRGLKGYSVILEPRHPVPAQALFVEYECADGGRPSPELVPRADGTVWMCGMPGNEALPPDPADVMASPQACAELARIAARLSPALEGARLLAAQACYRPICADAMPLIGPSPRLANAFVATAHNCWGMLNAPATGLAVSELVLDGESRSVDVSRLDPARRM